MRASTPYIDRVRAGAAALSERLDADGAEVAVVLGSGLARIADDPAGERNQDRVEKWIGDERQQQDECREDQEISPQ